MREINIFMEGGVIQHIENIPDDITVRVHDDEEYCLPENRSKEHYAISVSWNVTDVKDKGEEKGMKITTSEAIQVLDNMERNHDAELGITWTTIDCWLDELEIL